ncbi:MAG: hypothetical protein HC803_06755 [Saprospiraceae bacterium]|nr:hypothetical protein [Saprospiraceae bacterium]
MMDINEVLMELEFDFEMTTYETAKKQVDDLDNDIYQDIKSTLENYDDETTSTTDLEKIKNFYFKRKYLLRIQNNLSKFGQL